MASNHTAAKHIYNTIRELEDYMGLPAATLIEIFNTQSAANQKSLAAQVHGDTPAQFRTEAQAAADAEGSEQGRADDDLPDQLLGTVAADYREVA